MLSLARKIKGKENGICRVSAFGGRSITRIRSKRTGRFAKSSPKNRRASNNNERIARSPNPTSPFKKRANHVQFGSGDLSQLGFGFDRSFAEYRRKEITPEQNLWLEVLKRSLDDMFNTTDQRIRREAWKWWSDIKDSAHVCEMAGVTRSWVRSKVDIRLRQANNFVPKKLTQEETYMASIPYDLKTLREAAHVSQPWLANKLGVCIAKCRQMERADDPRVLTALIQSMKECDDERTITLREAYQFLTQH